jgi:hypothetical protein
LPASRQHRVGLRFRRQRNALPAEFLDAADPVLCPKGARDQLAAEADAEYGTVPGGEIARQVEQSGKVGILVVGQRVLPAAQHHQRIMAGGVLGQRLAAIGPAQVDLGFRFCKRRADLAEPGIVEILDDQHPHRHPDRV